MFVIPCQSVTFSSQSNNRKKSLTSFELLFEMFNTAEMFMIALDCLIEFERVFVCGACHLNYATKKNVWTNELQQSWRHLMLFVNNVVGCRFTAASVLVNCGLLLGDGLSCTAQLKREGLSDNQSTHYLSAARGLVKYRGWWQERTVRVFFVHTKTVDCTESTKALCWIWFIDHLYAVMDGVVIYMYIDNREHWYPGHIVQQYATWHGWTGKRKWLLSVTSAKMKTFSFLMLLSLQSNYSVRMQTIQQR